MPHSMTGFASSQGSCVGVSAFCEIRTVNQRFLDINWRLPEFLRALESDWRKILSQDIKRGKVEVKFFLQGGQAAAQDLNLHQANFDRLSKLITSVTDKIPQAKVGAIELLNWPGIVSETMVNIDEWSASATKLFQQAIDKVVETRAVEGLALTEFFNSVLDELGAWVVKVTGCVPEIAKDIQQRLQTRAQTMQIELDPVRFEQEMLYLLQKTDVAEELQRLSTHIEAFRAAIAKSGCVGRRLEFLLQEMQREVNTLGSKTGSMDLSAAVVEMKVLLEQMREQVQNIE